MSTINPLVSILVNCYNSEAFLKPALDSIYNQTYKNFQILLVDNCSTDNTALIAKQYNNKLLYIKTNELIPLYAARNVGLKYATGEFLAFLDSDDIWLPKKLEQQIKLMQDHKLDFIYSNYSNIVEHKSYFKRKVINFYLNLLKLNLFFRRSKLIQLSQIIKNYDINLQTVMIRKSAIKNLNFNECLNLYGDYEYFLKLLFINHIKPFYFSQLTSLSRVHEKQLSRKNYTNWIKESKICFRSLQSEMDQKEKRFFLKTNLLLHYSNLYMEKKLFSKALKIKLALSINSLSHTIHFLKSLLLVTKYKLSHILSVKSKLDTKNNDQKQ